MRIKDPFFSVVDLYRTLCFTSYPALWDPKYAQSDLYTATANALI